MKGLAKFLTLLLLVNAFLPFAGTALAQSEAPVAPQLIEAKAVTGSRVDLTWQDNSADEGGFVVERKEGSGAFQDVVSLDAGVTTYTDNKVDPEKTYTYRIKAVKGDASSESNEMTVTTMAAPTGLTATAVSATQINLSWTDASNHEDKYHVERKTSGGSYIVLGEVSDNTYQDTEISPGVTYYYRVRAINGSGFSAYSNEVNATAILPQPPAAPTGLTASAVTQNKVTLSWQDNSNNETRFKIERRVSGGNFTQIATVDANVTTFENTGLTANTEYQYRVRASNDAGDSAYSNVVTVSTYQGPQAPSGLTVSETTVNSITISWTDNSNNEQGFRIERRTGSGNYEQIATVGANVKTYKNTGLSQGTTYRYRVRAYNASGNSPYSNEVTAVTLVSAPTELKAAEVLKDRVTLTWKDNASREMGYVVERRTSSGSYEVVAYLSENATGYTDTDLKANTVYYYRVCAYNDGGSSGYSNVINVRTLAGDPPKAPSDLKITSVSPNRIVISWKDNANNEQGFRIERKTGNGSFTQIASVSSNTTTYTNSGLTNNTRYTYRVRAYNSYGNSGYSEEVSVVTGNPPAAPSDLKVVEVTKDKVIIAWTDNADNETGYKIERKTAGGSFTQIATTGANVTQVTNTNLSTNVQYTYRVRAYNASGDSAYSNEITVVPSDVPLAPGNLRVTLTMRGSVVMAWSDNAGNEQGYKIERRTAGGSYVQVATVAANTTTFMDTGLTGGATYYYRVRAYNANGNSAYSNEIGVTIPRDEVVVKLTIDKNTYSVNNQNKTMDVVPMIMDNRTMLPFRYVAEAIGADVFYEPTTKKVTVKHGNTTIELWIDNPIARVNGVEKRIDPDNLNVKPVVIPPGRTMMPIRFISESLGCSVEWNESTREVKITY